MRPVHSFVVVSFAVLVCAQILVAQKNQPAPPPIVPLSLNGETWSIANDIEFELDLGAKKGALTIYAPGWLDWTVAATDDTIEIGSLTPSAAAKLALLRTFMVGWVSSAESIIVENSASAARIVFEENVRFLHRRNGNRIVVDLEKVSDRPKKRKKKN